MAEAMAVTANHFEDAYTRNGFGWIVNCWEISVLSDFKPEVLECLTKWLRNVQQRWPDAQVVTQGEFGEAWPANIRTTEVWITGLCSVARASEVPRRIWKSAGS